MTPTTTRALFRVLVVDDNTSIHRDFQRILEPERPTDDFDLEAELLLGTSPRPVAKPAREIEFALAFASQGTEALEKVTAAQAAGEPFALAFMDMRMPPGWDGLTTIEKIWAVDPAIHVVICTAHSDRSWEEIAARLTAQQDRWVVLKKPFDKVEVVQLARVMTEKWRLDQARP